MIKNTMKDINSEIVEQRNNNFLKILDEFMNTIVMEKKYCSAGIEMKNTNTLIKLYEQINKQQINIDATPIKVLTDS